jgi:hypothetical protein
LIGLDARGGKITVGRNAYPPLTLKVDPAAVITRDGDPARLSNLEAGSQTVVPDVVLVSVQANADGSGTATRISATSRDHFWYGTLSSIDTSTSTIVVTRSDGQRRSFHLNDRTNVIKYGAANVAWNTMHVGMLVDVGWIPGENDANATILEAHTVILNKPYAGIAQKPPVSH